MTTSSPTFSIPQAHQAIQKAKSYLEDLFPELRPFKFEEIKHSSLPSSRWALTFSYKAGDFPFHQFKVVEISEKDFGLLQVSNR